MALQEPSAGAVAQRILAIQGKRCPKKPVDFLTRTESDALADAPDQTTWSGRRDRTLLLPGKVTVVLDVDAEVCRLACSTPANRRCDEAVTHTADADNAFRSDDRVIPSNHHCGLPRFLEAKQVERVLRSCDRRTKVGKRDLAILLLLARLGLRAGEVVPTLLVRKCFLEGGHRRIAFADLPEDGPIGLLPHFGVGQVAGLAFQ